MGLIALFLGNSSGVFICDVYADFRIFEKTNKFISIGMFSFMEVVRWLESASLLKDK